MADIAALLKDEPAPKVSTGSKLQSIIDSDSTEETPRGSYPSDVISKEPLSMTPKKALHWTERFKQNFNDATVGVDQLRHNLLPDKANELVGNAAREMVRTAFYGGGPMPKEQSDKYNPRSKEGYNNTAQWRERNYQAEKKAAGMPEAKLTSLSTWDMAGITGAVVNPINWSGPKSTAASALGRIAQASANGALVSLWQPVTESGDYWSNKLSQIKTGAVAGGLFASGAEALAPVLRYAKNSISKLGNEATPGAATAILDDAIERAGVNPQNVPNDFKNALVDEVVTAKKNGREVDPAAAVRQTRAASVGMKLSDAQALQDPVLYKNEQILRAKALGTNITMLDQQNKNAALNRLSEWGAGGSEGRPPAPNTYKTAQDILALGQQKNAALEQQISKAYDAVKTSDGRSALLDGVAFAKDAKNRLSAELGGMEKFKRVAPDVLEVLNSLETGKTPITVDNALHWDQTLGRSAYSADYGDQSALFNHVRKALNDAPIADNIGTEARQAYQFAKSLARDRFRLMDKTDPHYIPAFKAAVENEAPDKFFNKYIVNGNVRDIDKLLQFMPEIKDQIGNTSMLDLKNIVTNGTQESGSFSSRKLVSALKDPADIARYEVILGPNKTQQLINLRDAASDAFHPPTGTDVPSYTTGKSLIGNREATSAAASAAADMVPSKTVQAARALGDVVGGIKNKYRDSKAARKATEGIPGLTKEVKSTSKLLPKIEQAATVPLSILANQSSNEGE